MNLTVLFTLFQKQSRQFDKLFMGQIIKTMKTHARHQPRRNIIFYALSYIIQHGLVDV